MPTIAERFRGITGNQDERVIQYVVKDADDDQEAEFYTAAAAPVTYKTLPRQNVRVIEVDKKAFALREFDPVNYPGEFIEELDDTVPDGTYYTEAIYSLRKSAIAAEPTGRTPSVADDDANHDTFAFEQSLETVHIRESLIAAPLRFQGTDGDPVAGIELGGINVQGKGRVEGVDVRRPIGSFSFDYYPNKADVDQPYLDKVTGLVGSVNSASFYTKPLGTVLMTGASGRKRNENDWEFNFRFEYRPNVVGQTIGTAPNSIVYSAEGWQYVWVWYQVPDDPNDNKVLIPKQVNVETVYPKADLNEVFVPTP